MNATQNKSRTMFITSVCIFGTIGILRRYIPLSSSLVALVRGVIGAAFLLLVVLLGSKQLDRVIIRKNLLFLTLSGAAIGFNWILLFEAYNYTSVATATLCYYLAPILVILASPLALKEKLTGKKCLCVAAALVGMVFLSGVLQGGMPRGGELKGILLGLAAAVLYATLVVLNKNMTGLAPMDKTILQLGLSALVLLPYVLLTVEVPAGAFTPKSVLLLIFVGIVHTGLAYALYFDALVHIQGQTAAILSYLDPVVAVLASVLILQEPMLPTEAVGALLILGAALLSEVELPVKGRR